MSVIELLVTATVMTLLLTVVAVWPFGGPGEDDDKDDGLTDDDRGFLREWTKHDSK